MVLTKPDCYSQSSSYYYFQYFAELLPLAFRRNGEAVFTGVCLFTFRGGVPPFGWQGGTPSGWWWGVPTSRWLGVPASSWWGTPHLAHRGGGTPIWLTGYTLSSWWGGVTFNRHWMGVPPSQSGLDGGASLLGLDGGTPPPRQDWIGINPPPPPGQEIYRQSSYAAGGMPLAFRQDKHWFKLVYLQLKQEILRINITRHTNRSPPPPCPYIPPVSLLTILDLLSRPTIALGGDRGGGGGLWVRWLMAPGVLGG